MNATGRGYSAALVSVLLLSVAALGFIACSSFEELDPQSAWTEIQVGDQVRITDGEGRLIEFEVTEKSAPDMIRGEGEAFHVAQATAVSVSRFDSAATALLIISPFVAFGVLFGIAVSNLSFG